MKDIILSIKPCFTREIYSGSKTIELRKRIGKDFREGSKIYIYSSSPLKVIDGSAVIKKIEKLPISIIRKDLISLARIAESDFDQYYKGHITGVVIWLENINRFKKPLGLNELKKYGFSAPQSFCYVSSDLKVLPEFR